MNGNESNRRRRRSSLPLLLGALIAAMLGFGVARSQSGPPAQSGGWPIRLSYVLDTFGGETDMHAEFTLDAVDWTGWRQVAVCCDPETGLIVEFRPDGSLWSGGLKGLPLSKGFVHEGGDGMVPISDLAPRFPADSTELEQNDHITVLFDTPAGVEDATMKAEVLTRTTRLNLDPNDVLVYRVDRQVVTETLEQLASDVRWVYRPLNLTIRNEEFLDGTLTRVFEVVSVEFLPDSYQIPYGT